MSRIFLGFLCSFLMYVAAPMPSSRATKLGIMYLDHGWEPNLIIGVRERDRVYTYFVEVKLVDVIEGDSTTVKATITKKEMNDTAWDMWRREDVDTWGRR